MSGVSLPTNVPAAGGKSKRNQRLLMVVGAAAVLAILVSTRRGAGQDVTAAPEQGVGATAADPGPSTFADNGAGFGDLSSALSDSLGSVGQSLDGVTQGFNANADATAAGFDRLGDMIAQLQAGAGAATTAPGQVAQTGRPAGTATARTGQRTAGVHTDRHGAHKGERFVTTVSDRDHDHKLERTRQYESKPGRGDFGRGGRVRASGSDKVNRSHAASQHGAPRQSPSQKPAGHAQPAHPAPGKGKGKGKGKR